jgi:hypothetical protein
MVAGFWALEFSGSGARRRTAAGFWVLHGLQRVLERLKLFLRDATSVPNGVLERLPSDIPERW